MGVPPQFAEPGARVLHHRLLGVQVIGDGDNREEYHQRAAESHEPTETPRRSCARPALARPPEVVASHRQQQPTEIENQFHHFGFSILDFGLKKPLGAALLFN
jgi:hypothetical protein